MKKTTTRRAKADFRAELETAGLTQGGLHRLLGVSRVTVNRWCRSRGDALPVPQYARAFVALYKLSSSAARRALAAELGVQPGEA